MAALGDKKRARIKRKPTTQLRYGLPICAGRGHADCARGGAAHLRTNHRQVVRPAVEGYLGEEDIPKARHMDHMPEGVFGIAPADLRYQRAQQVPPSVDFISGFKPAIAMFCPIWGVRVTSHSAAMIGCQLSHILVMERGYLVVLRRTIARPGFGREGMAVQDGFDAMAIDT